MTTKIGLTDGEIVIKLLKLEPKEYGLLDIARIINKVASRETLKSVVEWGQQICPDPNHQARDGDIPYRRECPICWQSLTSSGKEGE